MIFNEVITFKRLECEVYYRKKKIDVVIRSICHQDEKFVPPKVKEVISRTIISAIFHASSSLA